MKKITLFIISCLLCSINASAASISADDLDFGTVSIKGETQVSGTSDVHVTWQDLPAGASVYAEITDGLLDEDVDNGFYVSGTGYFYIGYTELATNYDFTIGFQAVKAGTYSGKVRFWSFDENWDTDHIVEKIITVSVTITDDAIVAKTTPYSLVVSTSDIKANDTVVFVAPNVAVCGPLNGAALSVITEDVSFDNVNNTVEVPETAQTFILSQYSGNWQFTATGTTNRLLLDISGNGGFSYGEPDNTHLAGWGISVDKGIATISRPDNEQTYPIKYNDRFKPYLYNAGTDIALYKKAGKAHELQSELTLDADIDMGETEMEESKQIEVSYTGKYLLDDLLWGISGTDASLFTLTEDKSNTLNSGKLTISYNGEGKKTGAVDAKLYYLTTNIQKDMIDGSFPISLTLTANTIKLSSLSFDDAEKTAYLGETYDMNKHLTLAPDNAVDKSLTWSCTPSYNAEISEQGILTPKLSGEVTVTVSSVRVPELTTSCKVTIKVPAATAVVFEQTEIEMHIGDKTSPVVSIMPAAANQTLVFSSSNTAVATISAKGLITAKAIGTAVITAKAKENESLQATCTINVVATPVESISFGAQTIDVTLGTTQQLQLTILPAAAANENEVTYSSDDETIATVSATGLVTGIAQGKTTVIATCGGKQATIEVVVVQPKLFAAVTEDITLKSKDTIILARQEATWAVVAGPRNNKVLTPLKENITVTNEAAAADDAIKLVIELVANGVTITPVGASKALAESGNDFQDANTKNNSVWSLQKDDNGLFYLRNVGNTQASIKYLASSNYIKPYKDSTQGGLYMYVYYRPYLDPQTTGIADTVEQTTTARKLFVNGQLIIVTADSTQYNAQGMIIK